MRNHNYEPVFGVCDDPPPSTNPAYLDIQDGEKWIAWIDNKNRKTIKFTAIDHCIEIRRPNGEQESRCDGMLSVAETIIFLELKDRGSQGWLAAGIEQLKSTITLYKQEVGLEPFTRLYAIVSNKQRPLFKKVNTAIVDKFDVETGFILEVKQLIEVL